jgi:hypothetical protein
MMNDEASIQDAAIDGLWNAYAADGHMQRMRADR